MKVNKRFSLIRILFGIFVGVLIIFILDYYWHRDEDEKLRVENLILDRKFEEALQRSEKVIRRNPNAEWAHLSRALILELCGEFEAAEKEYAGVCKLFPDHPDSCFKAATYLLRKNRLDDAKAYFTRAATIYEMPLSSEGKYPDKYERLGIAYFYLGRYKEAKESFNKSLERNPQNILVGIMMSNAEDMLAKQVSVP